jgi:hypothetical protein
VNPLVLRKFYKRRNYYSSMRVLMNLKRGLACMLAFLIVASALMISDGNLVAAQPMVCISWGGTVGGSGITYPNPPSGDFSGTYVYTYTSDVKIDIVGATREYTVPDGSGTTTMAMNGNILTSNSVVDGHIKETGAPIHATVLYEQDQSDPSFIHHMPLSLEFVLDVSGITNLHVESKLTAIGMYAYNAPNGGIWSLENVQSEYARVRALGIDQNAQLQKVTGDLTETDSLSGFSFEMPELCYSPVVSVGAPVGGILMFADKVAVASPYFVLLALMAALAIVVLAKRKPRN